MHKNFLPISALTALLSLATIAVCDNSNEISQIPLAFLPTPLHKLTNLTNVLNGPKIFIKRDDLTGLALGGNKTRKLEFLLGDALKHDIDTIITAGAVQSNHCRQTAAAAAKLGLRCELLLNGPKPEILSGNNLLDDLLGATLHWRDEANQPKNLDELAQLVSANGHKPYIIPYGGSNAFGVYGYMNAWYEFVMQQKDLAYQAYQEATSFAGYQSTHSPITHIIVASCSGATQVGLVLGAKASGWTGKIIGISVDYDQSRAAEYLQQHLDLANATLTEFSKHSSNLKISVTAEDFIINYDYANGYAVVGDLEKDAIKLMAQTEGILLDPVYTGRAFGALVDMIKNGVISADDTVLFWHTGGAPAIFTHAAELTK